MPWGGGGGLKTHLGLTKWFLPGADLNWLVPAHKKLLLALAGWRRQVGGSLLAVSKTQLEGDQDKKLCVGPGFY